MQIIYEPSGAAREYAPLACNLYTTCPHGCEYCYCLRVLRKKPEEFFQPAKAKKDALERLKHDCKLLSNRNDNRTIFLSFIGDIYAGEFKAPEDNITRRALEILEGTNRHIKILTKRPEFAIRDYNIIRRNNWTLGTSFDGMSFTKSNITELRNICYGTGIKSWVSMEPIVDIVECKEAAIVYESDIDFWSFGRLSGKKDARHPAEWTDFKKFVNSILPPEKIQWKKSLEKF